MDGLTIKNGRLVNNRPEWMDKTGIQVGAEIRKEMKRAKKMTLMADAIDMAEDRKEMKQFFKGKF